MKLSLMPLGVEHSNILQKKIQRVEDEIIFDAIRR